MQILLVDDDPDILVPLGMALTREGFEVVTAPDGEQGWEVFSTQRPDFAVLDVTMPGLDGIALLQRIRASGGPYVPVILLTGRGGERDRVAGLDIGADDYVVKPCSHRELAARIRAILRRTNTAPRVRTIGGLTIDPALRRFSIGGLQVHVTPQEFELLLALMEQAGQVVRISALMKRVWGSEVSHDLLRVTVFRLRQKIEPNPKQPRYIHTVPSVGFMVTDEVSSSSAPTAPSSTWRE